MRTQVNITRLSGGVVEGNLYASATLIDADLVTTITDERIDFGHQPAKLRIDTSNSNKLIKDLAKSGLVPGLVEVDLKTSVRAGESSLLVVGFNPKKS